MRGDGHDFDVEHVQMGQPRTRAALDRLHVDAFRGRRWYVAEFVPSSPTSLGRAVFHASSDEEAAMTARLNRMTPGALHEIYPGEVMAWHRWVSAEPGATRPRPARLVGPT